MEYAWFYHSFVQKKSYTKYVFINCKLTFLTPVSIIVCRSFILAVNNSNLNLKQEKDIPTRLRYTKKLSYNKRRTFKPGIQNAKLTL